MHPSTVLYSGDEVLNSSKSAVGTVHEDENSYYSTVQ